MADKAKLQNKAVQEILEDAKDGVLKKKNIEKAKELSKKVEDKKEDKPKYTWVFKSKEYKSLEDIKALSEDFTDEVVGQLISRGKINRKG